MKRKFKKHARTLEYLARCDRHNAKSIVKEGKSDLITCFNEICLNILRNNVELTPLQKKKLVKYKGDIRELAGKSNIKKTRKIIVQKGGLLTALLAPMLGILSKGILKK